MVSLNYYYYGYFCLVDFDLFSCIDQFFLVLCAFVFYFDYNFDFVYIQQCRVSIVGNKCIIF